jgi:hypothetical protein
MTDSGKHTNGLDYKNITTVNDTSRVIIMMLQLGALHRIIILTTLDVSFMLLELSIMLLENIYSTGVTHDNRHLQSSYFYSTGHSLLWYTKNFVHKKFYSIGPEQ